MTSPSAPAVTRLDPRHAERIAAVLAEAFAGYPVMAWVLGGDEALARPSAERDRLTTGGASGPVDTRHATLVRMFVMARVLRGEPLLGVFRGDDLVAAAIASFPDGPPAPPEFLALRPDVWRRLGPEAEARYEAYGRATRAFDPGVPHVHLNMLGVRAPWRREGLGRTLIDEVQAIARARPGTRGLTLNTESAANAAYYTKLGFEVIGRARVSPALESWGFYRSN